MNVKNILKSAALMAVAIIGFAACTADGDSFEYGKTGFLMTGTEKNPLVKFSIENPGDAYSVTVSSTAKVTEDVTLSLAIDNSLVEQYNAENGTNFAACPEGVAKLSESTVKIKAGSALSDAVKMSIETMDKFEDGPTYLVPVTIKQVQNGGNMTVIEGSRTIYLRISRMINFYSLRTNMNASSNFIFPDDKAVNLTNWTYEVKVYVTNFGTKGGDIRRVCCWTEKDESNSTMLRFGENGYDAKSLQVVQPAGNLVSQFRFDNNKWYLLTITYDGKQSCLYVDGNLDSSVTSSGKTCNFQRFELGMSWGGYYSSQFMNGRMCEVRVWNRALSGAEIAGGIAGVDPKSNGLIAYWKMNQSEGTTIYDVTGNGYDMDWTQTVRDKNESGNLTPTPEAANYISWVRDDNNKVAQ